MIFLFILPRQTYIGAFIDCPKTIFIPWFNWFMKETHIWLLYIMLRLSNANHSANESNRNKSKLETQKSGFGKWDLGSLLIIWPQQGNLFL